MKKSRSFIVATAAALVAGSAFAQNETIAVFTKNQTNPDFQAVRLGADAAAKALGAKTVHYVPSKPDSIPEQMNQVDDVVVKKPDSVVFIPVDYKALVPSVEKLNSAKIPVINVGDRSAGGTFVSFVGIDNYELGLETARYLFDKMGGKGNVVILEGVKGAITSMDRARGFADAIKEFKDVKLLASQPANYQRLQGLQVMENLLQSYPQIDGVLAANDAMAIGAAEALEGADRKAKVIGINGTKEAIDAIKAGKLLATGNQDSFTQGCIGTTVAIRSLRNEAVISEVLLKPSIVDTSNLRSYDVAPETRSCPTWEQIQAVTTKK